MAPVGADRVRPPLSPDSLTALRKPAVDKLMAQIAGHENDPAENVFENVRVIKGLTAVQFVQRMDAYGRALGVRCTFCHVAGNYASDSLRPKQTARLMTTLVADINSIEMPKINATRPPMATCMTCHHGMMSPSRDVDGALSALNKPKPPGGG